MEGKLSLFQSFRRQQKYFYGSTPLLITSEKDELSIVVFLPFKVVIEVSSSKVVVIVELDETLVVVIVVNVIFDTYSETTWSLFDCCMQFGKTRISEIIKTEGFTYLIG